MSIRTRLIRILEALGREDDEVFEQEEGPTAVAVVMGPDGRMHPVPPGVHPMQYIQQLQASHQRARPDTTRTMRHGPSSELYDLKTVECAEQVSPDADPEVKKLLAEGWEPFGVHKTSFAMGTPGIRMYFRRELQN